MVASSRARTAVLVSSLVFSLLSSSLIPMVTDCICSSRGADRVCGPAVLAAIGRPEPNRPYENDALRRVSFSIRRVTNDEISDGNAIADSGNIIWIQTPADASEQRVMLWQGGTIRQIGVVPAAVGQIYTLMADGGWVFWEVRVSNTNNFEKYIYKPSTGTVTHISSATTNDAASWRFKAGRIVWTCDEGLAFFNGTQTSALVQAGNYYEYLFGGDAVAWEEKTGQPSPNDKKIMYNDGTATICLSALGAASGMTRHVLAGGDAEGRRVAWKAFDGYDDEILFYDGSSVRKITDNRVSDGMPRIEGQEIAWWENPSKINWTNGTETLVVTTSFGASSSLMFEGGRVIEYTSTMVKVWDSTSRVVRAPTDTTGGLSSMRFTSDGAGVFIWGVKWNYQVSAQDYECWFYDGNSTTMLVHTLGHDTLYPSYKNGYAIWTDTRENRVTLIYWDPSQQRWVEFTSTFWENELFYWKAGSQPQMLTSTSERNRVSPARSGAVDNGMAVWAMEPLPPPPNKQKSEEYLKNEVYLYGAAVDDASISSDDIVPEKVLEDGKTVNIIATVRNPGSLPLSSVRVNCLVDTTPLAQVIIPSIAQGGSATATFQWPVSWDIKGKLKKNTTIEVTVDPADEIAESNENNNQASKILAGIEKGSKKATTDGKGFQLVSHLAAAEATPLAIWFDDDAGTSATGQPTRHYNPMATTQAALTKIEDYFNGTQYPNGIDQLDLTDFAFNARDRLKTYWQNSPGIVIAQPSNQSEITGAPIASYLNWPMVNSGMAEAGLRDALAGLISDLGVTYAIVIGDNRAGVDAIIANLKSLNLPPGKALFVKGSPVEPLDSYETVKLFDEILRAFGDRSSSIVVTNSRDDSCLAAAPLAAFYKALILDVRDVVTTAVSYAPNTYAGLSPINNLISGITNKTGDHDLKGYYEKHMQHRPNVFLVGTVEWIPFGIVRDPVPPPPPPKVDSDGDWIATDFNYYNYLPATTPGGRLLLSGADNINYVGRALQFAELSPGNRDVGDGWENSYLAAGIYSPNGVRRWDQHQAWWLDSAIYQVRQLAGKSPGARITEYYEDASAHGCVPPNPWVRFDNYRGKVVWKAPIVWDTRDIPGAPANRNDGVNNDGDSVGCENNDSKFPLERIRDLNGNGRWDAGEPILDKGLVDGIQATTFWNNIVGLCVDEEVWDGADNDGDGQIDEDCSFARVYEVEQVYRECLEAGDPEINPADIHDLIDTNLMVGLNNKGIIIYSGHAWTDVWAISNIGGNSDPDGAGPAPPLTNDDRSYDRTHLHYNEVLSLAPALVIASACGSARAWEANNIGTAFLKQGALAYVGATSVAYSGASDDFASLMVEYLTWNSLPAGFVYGVAINRVEASNLWAARYGGSAMFAEKTKYEYTLFGLGSEVIDPGLRSEPRVTYGAPVYDAVTRTWSVDVTCDIPAPREIKDAQGNVTNIALPSGLATHFSDTADRPPLRILPFQYQLPPGGRLVQVSLLESTVFKNYNLSLYNLTDSPKLPDEDTIEARSIQSTGLFRYPGPLYPDTLYVSNSQLDGRTNADVVSGSVTAYQVDGTVPRTTVFDAVKLKITYTAPVGLTETHTIQGNTLNVAATISSADGNQHTVTSRLQIETTGGIVVKEMTGTAVTVSQPATAPSRTQTAPRATLGQSQTVNFTVTGIPLSCYVCRITIYENNLPAGEISFEVGPTLRASTGTTSGLEADGVAVVNVNINQITDANTGAPAQIPGGIGGFQATASGSPAGSIEWIGVREVAPYLNPSINTSTGAFGVSNVASPQQPNNSTVAKLMPKLVGDKDTACTMTVTFNSITPAGGGVNVPEQSPSTAIFKRGDANKNGTVDVFDAMFIAQYIVGNRPVTDLNVVNGACVKHDGTSGDKLDIFDAMFIAQMIVGVRNSRFD